MARPKKYGLDYFPLDVVFYSDTKVNRLKARYGNNGVMVFIILLCKIYEKGFYVDYDDDIILDISFILSVKENFTRQVIKYLISGSMLDSKLADECKILTSCPIQRRFQGSKRTPVRVNAAYWLLEKEETASLIQLYHNDDKCYNNEGFCYKNSDKCAENETDKSRVDKSRVDKREGGKPPDLSLQSKEGFILGLYNTFCHDLPKVKAMSEQRTEKARKLYDLFDLDQIKLVFMRANNSNFLKGKNDRGWTATFDWIINPDNFRKVMEGNYDNRQNKNNSSSFDISDIEGLANKF